MTRFRLVFAFLLFAPAALAQEVSTTIVPVVGSIFGPTLIRWRTDVELVNDSALPADVALELVAVPNAPLFFFTLGPGEAQRFPDIVGQAFGTEAALSPLRVTTTSRRGVAVRAQAYAVRGATVSPMQALPAYDANTWFPVRVLDGLAFSEDFRTNVGLVNTGSVEAEFTLALQRIPGRNVAITHVRVAAGSLVHMSIQSLFPLITDGHGFAVVVETPHRETHIYASVIENLTNEGTFVVPRVGGR